ncbi:MAG: hypothetical protein KGZ88_14090 [Methylomicrobium sp.]|nr:hypothetical protein [Methylomicrobium sp.]
MSEIDFELDLPEKPEQPQQNQLIALAKDLGYTGELSVGALEDGIRASIRRTIDECLELGARLLLLKEATVHGEFTQRLSLLGIDIKMARKFMAATRKFSKGASKGVLLAAGTQTKMLELLVLDDDEIEAIGNGESIGDINLSELECMSVSELRQAVRDRDKKIENHETEFQKLHDKHETIERNYQRLTKAKQPGESAYNARTVEVRHEAAALEYASRINVDALDVIYGEVINDPETSHQERELQLHAIAIAAGGLLARAELLFTRLKEDLGALLPIKTNGNYLLTDEEKARLQDSVTMIDINFTRAKNKRDIERSAERPGPGRKKGSTNKKGGDDA